jgi:MioC protein
MDHEVEILVGTMSGTADMVADELSTQLRKKQIRCRIRDMSECSPATLRPGVRYIICTATYGEGDLPDNAQPFYDALAAAAPDLAAIRYGVICLGDRIYATTFCGAGKRFDALLASLGAVRIGERMENDASAGTFADEAAVEWLGGWLAACAEADLCAPEAAS